MKTPARAIAVFALFVAAGCGTAPAKPPYAAFETIPVPSELEYRADGSSIIETPDVRAGRVLYRGRIEPETLAAAMRSNLEADGWKPMGITTSGAHGSTQLYDKAGTSLQVRIWEGGPFAWYTYLELASVETGPARVAPTSAPHAPSPTSPSASPRPTTSVIPDAPAPVVTR